MSRKAYLKIAVVAVSILSLFFSANTKIYAGENLIYGHVSYVDKEAFVLKSGEDRALKAVVNLPLIPGDIIYTEGNGRCEIQFDNGTIMRLDKNTELKLDTVLAKSLTTKDKITTLQLKKGSVYSMNQVYKGEIFQVITPTAAIKMYKRSTNTISVNKDGETYGSVQRGKVGVLYGKDHKSSDKEYTKIGKGFLITKDYDFKETTAKKDVEFHAWNKYINKNFKELHYGKSKVPAIIYRRSPGIVHFAEKWSSRLGVWEYNDLFGYVWKPYSDLFIGSRPFFDANYVEINGELVLVPNRAWGWAPAHLGTWFFSKQYGWLWIPGNAFSRGICSIGLLPLCCLENPFSCSNIWYSLRCYAFGSLGHWINYIFGSKDLYMIYRTQGRHAWQNAYYKEFGCEPRSRKPDLDGVPENIVDILKKMNKAPIEKIEKHIASKTPDTTVKLDKTKIIRGVKFNRNKSMFLAPKNVDLKNINPGLAVAFSFGELISHNGCDWNPDSRWASKVGVTIHYSSKENAVVCPNLNISSKHINDWQRYNLKRSIVNRRFLHYTASSFNGSSGTGSSSSSGSIAVSGNAAISGGKATGTASGNSGSSGNTEK